MVSPPHGRGHPRPPRWNPPRWPHPPTCPWEPARGHAVPPHPHPDGPAHAAGARPAPALARDAGSRCRCPPSAWQPAPVWSCHELMGRPEGGSTCVPGQRTACPGLTLNMPRDVYNLSDSLADKFMYAMQGNVKERQYIDSGKVQPFGQPTAQCICSRACLVCSSRHSTRALCDCPSLRRHHRSWVDHESSTGFQGNISRTPIQKDMLASTEGQ